MKIGITLKKSAYTPEAYAYANYLREKGNIVQLDFENNLDINNDINIYFMGIRSCLNHRYGGAKEIHEYHSLSIGSFPRLKNGVKKYINRKPDGRIFLNSVVEKEFLFKDKIPTIHRDMGVDDIFFQNIQSRSVFDIVYCGSILGRRGLVETLVRLSQNFKIVVIGDVPKDIRKIFMSAKITMTGRLEREEIIKIYKMSNFGLNFTPDIYPFNIQTSTKTLEYLAAGLNVISNRYSWVEKFSCENNIEMIWLDEIMHYDTLYRCDYRSYSKNLERFRWNNILDSCNFSYFLEGICSG
ncbi:glycosyl transferase [Glaesserella parasuis]|nr:glycosyl transferase [Glaesserella parasuis]MDO9904113.1 glycosyl transferase [Glaesserella parasuis]MDO9921331.1 glycosyl transferase [Glaesserella parasuis]MDP0114989.1 glycosyl transferase [Glaesserella parasuis]